MRTVLTSTRLYIYRSRLSKITEKGAAYLSALSPALYDPDFADRIVAWSGMNAGEEKAEIDRYVGELADRQRAFNRMGGASPSIPRNEGMA